MFSKKKVEVEKVEEKWDCKKQGHDYKAVDHALIVSGNEKLNEIILYIECERCGKRQIMTNRYGSQDSLSEIWRRGEISTDDKKKLEVAMNTFLEKGIKNRLVKKAKKPVKKTKGGK